VAGQRVRRRKWGLPWLVFVRGSCCDCRREGRVKGQREVSRFFKGRGQTGFREETKKSKKIGAAAAFCFSKADGFFGWEFTGLSLARQRGKNGAGLGGSCRNGGGSPCKQRVAAFCVVFV